MIQYSEGGYFGDSDVFAQELGVSLYVGRDSSSTCTSHEISIFVLNKEGQHKMKENFEVRYNEMAALALKKYKNHQVHINQRFTKYIKFL